MQVTLIKKTHISTLSLPEKVSGRYWITDYRDGMTCSLMPIEAKNGEWFLKSGRNAKALDTDGNPVKSMVLKEGTFYELLIAGEADRVILFAEPVTNDRSTFHKYSVAEECMLSIGRNSGNDIVCRGGFVSGSHARLSHFKGMWRIVDLGSTNGTFVNNSAVTMETAICPGDLIYIMGVKIVVGDGFFAINNPDGTVSVQGQKLKKLQLPAVDADAGDEEDEIEHESEYFYRSPRFKRDVEPAKFKIDPPPSNQVGDEMPLMLTIGPSVTMGMAAVATGSFTIVNAISNGNMQSAIPSAVMSASMLLGTMLWPLLTKTYEKRRKKKREEKRQKKYAEYLEDVRKKISEETDKQCSILTENSVLPQECMDRVQQTKNNLWERSARHNDFLHLRLGMGSMPLQAEVVFPEWKFSLDEDNLQNEMYQLGEGEKLLENVPITLSLAEHPILGVVGNRAKVIAFAKGLVLQLVTLYGYDEVKCVFLYDPEEEDQFSFARWLPHVWNDNQSMRFVATDAVQIKEVSSYFEHVIEERQALKESEAKEATPYFVVFAMSKDLSLRAEMLKKIYASKEALNISVIACFDELKNLPKECSTVVELDGNGGRIFDKNDVTSEKKPFLLDALVFQDLLPVAKQLANIHLDTASGMYKLPQMITFLEMFGVGEVEHLNSVARWKENDPTKSLAAAVGVNTLGDTFMLDLHEKFHGPHGLVAGMTGSGKSEFIITYILSLAVNYHPNEVSFVLIDYKGGGMAKSFEKLPHTAGIITNLDGAAIKRSLISIESELRRRQAIFREASQKVGVSNIDIYKYQKLYREGAVSEPLQHLFIISDEFAELKAQKPEFMAQLVSAARIGRSLGVHLILATQKPSGVVDDQIWSNSKFKVCLKVQDRSDSMDMLKRPDAAELADTGRFYLQVGYNELFELGQSAWAGAPYYPSDKVVSQKDDSVVFIDPIGHVIKRVKADKHAGIKAQKQLDVITAYLSQTAREEHIAIRKLWLDPIPAKIYLDQIREKYGCVPKDRFVLDPLIGEYDDPWNQRQCAMTLPISEEGNAIIYGSAGSGKTTFLNAMLYSLITQHTPDEVNIYILDFAAETLRAFEKAPHVGDVVLAHEAEKISNLFKLLLSELEQRKKRFSDYGGDYRTFIETSGSTLPNIVVVINNFTGFVETCEEKEEAVSYLTREGRKYGMYFVLTAVSTGAVRFRMLQNFKQLLTMQLNDESDYSTVIGKTDGVLPARYKGRGLFKTDSVYEFQTAYITEEPIPYSFIQMVCNTLMNEWSGTKAKKIPVLPETVDVAFAKEYYDSKRTLMVPIGVEVNSMSVVCCDYSNQYISLLLSAEDAHSDTLQAIAQLVSNATETIKIIDIPGTLDHHFHTLPGYVNSEEGCVDFVNALFEEVVHRHNTWKEFVEKGKTPDAFEQQIIFINSLTALLSSLTGENKEKMQLILERGETKFNISIIVAENVRNLTGISFEKWYKKHITQGDGYWIGNGFDEQYQLKSNVTLPGMRDAIGNDFGYFLQKGKLQKLKVIKYRPKEVV